LLDRPGVADVHSVYILQGLYLQGLYVYMKYTRPGRHITMLRRARLCYIMLSASLCVCGVQVPWSQWLE